MTAYDGKSYIKDGRIVPSLRAMVETNVYAMLHGHPEPYRIADYYHAEPEEKPS